jgi:hypothetical protein
VCVRERERVSEWVSEAACEVGARRRHVGSRGLKEMRDISGVEKSGIFRSQKKRCRVLASRRWGGCGGKRRHQEGSSKAAGLLYCCFTAA